MRRRLCHGQFCTYGICYCLSMSQKQLGLYIKTKKKDNQKVYKHHKKTDFTCHAQLYNPYSFAPFIKIIRNQNNSKRSDYNWQPGHYKKNKIHHITPENRLLLIFSLLWPTYKQCLIRIAFSP